MDQPSKPADTRTDRRPSAAARFWKDCVETFQKVEGIAFVALLVAATGAIIVSFAPGQDLVTTVAEEGAASPWVICLCVVIAYFGLQAWFWSRLVVVWNYGADRERWRPRWLLVWAPRVLGVAPLLLVGAAMVVVGAGDPGAGIAVVVVAVVLLAVLIKREDVTRALMARSATLARMHRARPNGFRRAVMLTSVLVAVAAWVAMTFWTVPVSQRLGPMATVYLALSGIIPLVVLVLRWGRRTGLPIASAIVALAAVLTALPWAAADNHVVGRRAPFARMDAPLTGKQALTTAYQTWSEQAPAVGGAQPLILVASEGGASRAAYWTAAVLAALQDRTQGQFSKSVFGVTAVSGGSVGAVGFLAALDGRPPSGDDYWKALQGFVGADFLSPALGGMLFPDLTQRALPLAVLPDRAQTIEQSWEAAWRTNCRAAGAHCTDPNQLAKPFLALWKPDHVWRPLLLIEGAREETGARILTSNLTASSIASFTDAEDFHADVGRDVAASTAILNGARYPWISPAGTLLNAHGDEAGHIVDGGYFDPSGAETTRELALGVLRATGPNGQRLSPTAQPVLFLVIGNCASAGPQDATQPASGQSRAAPKTKRLLADLVAPLVGLYSARDGHQTHMTNALIADVAGAQPTNNVCQQAIVKGWFQGHVAYYVPFKLCPTTFSVPLDWVLSGRAKTAMLRATGYGGPPSCLAGKNIGWLVRYLTTGQDDIPARPPPQGP